MSARRRAQVGRHRFCRKLYRGRLDHTQPDDLIRVLVRNRREVEDVIHGSWAGRLLYRLRHLLHRNSQRQQPQEHPCPLRPGQCVLRALARRHDELLVGLVRRRHDPAHAGGADTPRCAAPCAWPAFSPGDRVLEIGCGWGALAEMATTEFEALDHRGDAVHRAAGVRAGPHAANWEPEARPICGCRTTATSTMRLSMPSAPSRWSKRLAASTGPPTLPDGGHRLLKPGGYACVQSIVIDDALFDRYMQSTDFIQQYIFPGGCSALPARVPAEAAAAGLQVVDEFAFGHDYADTLRRWREHVPRAPPARHATRL